jgi:hypothetical protein
VTDSIQSQPFAQPFNERSALEELERLADKIQVSRRQREQKVAEFDAFVRTFRHDRYTTAIAAHEKEARRAEDRPLVSAPVIQAARSVTTADPIASVPAAPAVATVEPPLPAPPVFPAGPLSSSSKPRPRPRAAHIGVVLAGLAVIAVAVLLWRSADAPVGQPAAARPPATTAPPPARAAAPGAAAAAPAPVKPAGPPRALNIEFVTVRPVWARITVDGRRAMEREFKADQRIPFGADRAIVIRAGDAGAIRLVVDGRDLGVLGRDGQVFERVFTPK